MDIIYILSQNKKEIFPSLHNKVTITLIQVYGKQKKDSLLICPFHKHRC